MIQQKEAKKYHKIKWHKIVSQRQKHGRKTLNHGDKHRACTNLGLDKGRFMLYSFLLKTLKNPGGLNSICFW